jgi:hypothetical protein
VDEGKEPGGETVILRDLPEGLARVKRERTLDRDLQRVEAFHGKLPGDLYLRLSRNRDFRRVRAGYLIPRANTDQHQSGTTRFLGGFKRLLIGRPLASAEESEQRVNRFVGLAVFASDNISSSAYATEEIMRVLLLAGVGALTLTLPITLVICLVLGIVVLSYRQVIRAYPNGGGSYVVAKDNLGPLPGLAAGAALLTDYILTVSVSTAAGVAAITAAFPDVFEKRVAIMLLVVAFMTLMNLRGIRESGRALPSRPISMSSASLAWSAMAPTAWPAARCPSTRRRPNGSAPRRELSEASACC